MRITSITGYRQDQPFRDGPYICSGGRSALGFDSIICAIATDAGITGWGEMAPLGAFYDPGLRRRGAGGLRRARPGADRPGPDADRRPRPAHGSSAEGPSLCQGGARHGLLGHPGQEGRSAAGRAARRALWPGGRSLPLGPPGEARAHGGPGQGLCRRGLSAHPGEGRPRSRRGYRAADRRARGAGRRRSCSSPMPIAAGPPIRRAASCARPATSTITWSSPAPPMPNAGRCAAIATGRWCSTNRSTASRPCSRPMPTASPMPSPSSWRGSAASAGRG